MKRFLHPALISLLMITIFACGQSEEDKAVNDLVREASELVRLAEGEQKVTEAEYLEREALDRLERAVSDYPSSPLTAGLLEGETKIGPYTYEEFKARITAREEALARASAGEGKGPVEEVLEQAGELAGRPGPLYYQSGLLARIAAAYSRRGHQTLADEFFVRALLSAQAVEAPYYKILAFSELAGQYVAAGRESEAADLLLEAVALKGEIEVPFFRSGAAFVIASRYLEIGWDEEAMAIVGTIEEPYYRARSALKLAEGRLSPEGADQAPVVRELLERARGEADQIEDPVLRVEIIIDCAGWAARLGDPSAEELFRQARALAEALDDTAPRAGALVRIASWYGKLDRREEGEALLERATELAGTIENNIFKDLVLLDVAEVLAELGDYDRALEIGDLVDSPRFRALCLTAVSECYLAAGEEDKAIDLAARARLDSELIETPHFQADILIRAADCLHHRYAVPLATPEPPAPQFEEPPAAGPTDESVGVSG